MEALLTLPAQGGGWVLELYLDTANLDEIRTAHSWGILSGVTTNPTLIAKEGAPFHQRIREICEATSGPVSAEVTALEAGEMIRQGEELAALHERVVIKVPLTADGLRACKHLTSRGYKVNVTLIFSLNQALLAARAGATYVSPFVGRLDDVGHDGIALVADVVEVLRTHNLPTRVIAASLRHPHHVSAAARAGAHIGTMPFAVMRQMFSHPLTDIGLQRFLEDWRQAGLL